MGMRKGKAWAGYLELKPHVIFIQAIAIKMIDAVKNSNAGENLFLISCRIRVSIKYKLPKNNPAPQIDSAHSARMGGNVCSTRYFMGRYSNKSY